MESLPVEELPTDSVPPPVGPISMWQATMITSYDMMMIVFTSDKSELEHPPADEAYLGREHVRARSATECAVHDHRVRHVEPVSARGDQG